MQNVDLIIGISVLVILLTCYIIALVKSKRGEMVLTSNGWDMALLLACPIFFFAGWCVGLQPPDNTFQYIVFGISAICRLGTIIFSIIANTDSIWKILCSILAKLFIVWLTLFILLLLITILVVYAIVQVMKEHENEEFILLKYDRFLHAYVGYRV